MTRTIRLYDDVALIEDLPHEGLIRGQVGTAIEELEPDVFEVDFSDTEERTYASVALHARQLMVLHRQPVRAS